MAEQILTWSGSPDKWDTTLFTWSDRLLIAEVLGGGGDILDGSKPDHQEPDKWKKKKRLIQLVLYVRDKKIVEEKEIVDMDISIKDVLLVKKEITKKMNIKFPG